MVVLCTIIAAPVRAQDGGHASAPVHVAPGAVALPHGVTHVAPTAGSPAAAIASREIHLDTVPLSATVLRAGRAAKVVERPDKTAVIDTREVLFTKTATTAQIRPSSEASFRGATRFVLPYEFRHLWLPNTDGGGGGSQAEEVRTSHLVAEIAGGGLRLAAGENGYVGIIHIALEDVDNAARNDALPEPANVLMTADVDSVDPDRFPISRTGSWVDVTLRALDPEDPVQVHVRTPNDPDGLVIPVGVVKPGLAVVASPPSIAGLGLETATVVVSAAGVPDPAGRKVVLATERGSLASPTVELDEQGLANTTLRSISVGRTTVTASSPLLADGHSDPIEFEWPWSFLLAALLGGSVGGVIQQWQGTRAGRAGGRSRQAAAVLGALVGLVVVALYAVGVNVSPFTPTATGGEALVFALAAVGGFLGLRIAGAT